MANAAGGEFWEMGPGSAAPSGVTIIQLSIKEHFDRN
jgi:hypothetical protein